MTPKFLYGLLFLFYFSVLLKTIFKSVNIFFEDTIDADDE